MTECTHWKGHMQAGIVAAATFEVTWDIVLLTMQSTQSPILPDEYHALYKSLSIYFNKNESHLMPIVIDSGASKLLLPNINDFVGELHPATSKN